MQSVQIVCRELQKEQLLSIIGKRGYFTVPSLFIFGHTATGKTLTLHSMLVEHKLPCVLVNCVETYTERILYEQIINEFIRNTQPETAQSATSGCNCDNASDFVRLLREAIVQTHREQETVYIVLDKAERLRSMEANVLPVFLRLQELAACNVTVILISEIVWEKFRSVSSTGSYEPLIVHFPDYSKDELLEIMQADCPDQFPASFYANYARIIVNVFYTVTRSVQELRYMASVNFGKYAEPVTKGEADVTNLRLLWKNVEPHLRASMRTIYLREMSSKQWEEAHLDDTCTYVRLNGRVPAASFELPFFSKFLLVAAYLASYNPAKSDRRFFVKASSKKKKTKGPNKSERTSNQLLGPKPFALDRLLAIFYSIIDSKVPPTASLFCQVSSLVTLQFLSQVGSSLLDSPKYKCLVTLDFIKAVARTVQFDIVKYLYDFV